jgi:hypothetical protein
MRFVHRHCLQSNGGKNVGYAGIEFIQVEWVTVICTVFNVDSQKNPVLTNPAYMGAIFFSK